MASELDLWRVRIAAKRRQQANREWHTAIREACARGVPSRTVGKAAGITHARVLQIVHHVSTFD